MLRNQERKKEFEEFLNKLDELFPDDHCPFTNSVPVIPFATQYHSFELGSILKAILVHGYQRNPVTRQPWAIADLGKKVKPNYPLIKKVDKELSKHGFNREKYLQHFGISPDLYEHLLDFGTFSNSVKKYIHNKLKFLQNHPVASHIGIGLGFFALYIAVFESFAQSCNPDSQDTWYHKTLATFQTETIDNPGLQYGTAENTIQRRVITSSPVCEALAFQYIRNKEMPSQFKEFEKYYPLKTIPIQIINDAGTFRHETQKFVHSIPMGDGSVLPFAAPISTYFSCKLFRSRRDGVSLSNTNKSLLLVFLAAIGLLIIDALTDCFGFVSFIGRANVNRDGIERACNDGFSVVDKVRDIPHVFTIAKTSSLPSKELCMGGPMSRATAVKALAFATGGSMLLGRWLGKQEKTEREFEVLARDGYDYASKIAP